MTDLDLLWRRHAPADLLAQRPDFRIDPQRPGGQTFYAELHVQAPEIDRVLADLTADPDLSAAIAAGQPDACHLTCELIRAGEPADLSVSDFSMRAYLDWYPDIACAGIDPLHHYLLHGQKEKRRTLAALRETCHAGRRPYNPDLPTCLIAVHELSRTGAPIVGLDLAREAAETHNVIVATLRGGPLFDSFLDHACELVETARPLEDLTYCRGAAFAKIDHAILNSVECFAFVPFLVAREIPFAAYVHEYADYTFPAYKSTFTALFADLLIFSSDHVRDSWAGRLKDIEFDTARDTMVLPQRAFAVGGVEAGRLAEARARISALIGRDCSQVRLVCGAGHLQWRKGTDIFAMTAQICRPRDPDTVFLWIGDGLNPEEMGFGVWMDYHLRQIRAGDPAGNLFLLPAGPAYPDVLAASDAMFVSSRLDPLPNVVFDALDAGCRIVLFAGASGFGDAAYRRSDHILPVDYANPEAAATALLALPRKTGLDHPPPPRPQERLFDRIRAALDARLRAQRYFVRGAGRIDVPMLFPRENQTALRVLEREKTMRYGRRWVWRDPEEAEATIRASDNWVHRGLRIAPGGTAPDTAALPPFSVHVHAFYTDDLARDIRAHSAYRLARRIVVTTDTERKADEIRDILESEGLVPEVVLVPNRGRDILPFMELFLPGGAAKGDEIWCHLHQKKSLGSTDSGEVWRQFLLRILLGDEASVSDAVLRIAEAGTGLVAPFDPYCVPWNASRALLPKIEPRLPGPLPDHPLLFPVGNMFWVRRPVVEAMNALFGAGYPWPNEPIANDGTEFHLIERLWPAITASCGLRSVFVHKLDQRRV